MGDATNLPESIDSKPQADEDVLSAKVTLADLCAKGTALYAVKNYSEAMDYYAQAAELQAQINGDMAPENAEILFLYGRTLYEVGQSKSDILGGRSGDEKRKSKGSPKPKTTQLETVTEGDGENVGVAAAQSEPMQQKSGPKSAENVPKRPLFSFSGDENFEESDEEEEEAQGEGEEEEDGDELALGFQILDLARILLERRLQRPEGDEQDGKGKGNAKAEEDSSMTRHLRERLADTLDLLGDISLENERYPNAIGDFRASLAHKQRLYPEESEIIAEAHFKLALALEFGSLTTTSDANDSNEEKDAKEATVDEEMRAEAVRQLELAIESTKLKLHNKEVLLAETSSPEDNDTTRGEIANTKEILQDMEQRLIEMRVPTIDLNNVLSGMLGDSNTASSIMGTKEGETRAEADARIEEAKKNATDLSGLARKKAHKPKSEPEAKCQQSPVSSSSHGKRKSGDDNEGEPKKARFDK